MKKTIITIFITTILLGCYNLTIEDPWWVFRDNNTTMRFIENDFLIFREEQLLLGDSSRIFIYADGYKLALNDSQADYQYRLRLYLELFFNNKLENITIKPENIEIRINDSLMSFDKIVAFIEDKKNHKYDLQFTYDHIEEINPNQELFSSKLSGYFISMNFNDFLLIDSKVVKIDSVLGVQRESIYLQTGDSFSPFNE